MNRTKRMIWLSVGFVSLALGAVGAVLPLLPAFPFLMVTLFAFSKSSERFHKWFLGTRLYKSNLQMYVEKKGMTWKVKIRIMVTVTILMTIGFVMMKEVVIGRVVLGIVWVFHILLFTFKIKTLSPKEAFSGEF